MDNIAAIYSYMRAKSIDICFMLSATGGVTDAVLFFVLNLLCPFEMKHIENSSINNYSYLHLDQINKKIIITNKANI